MTSSAYPSRFGAGPPVRVKPALIDTFPRGVWWMGAAVLSGTLWTGAIWTLLRLL